MRLTVNKERIKGVLTPSKGLQRRRLAEAAFWLGMDSAEAREQAWAEISTVDGWPMLRGE